MIVIVDIDDVLIPWAERVHEACIEAGLNPDGKPWTQWNMWEDYGCEKDAWVDVVGSLAVAGGLYHGEPYPGAVNALWRLEAAGHSVHLVTARGFHAHAEEIRRWTSEWLTMYHVPGYLHFAEDKAAVARQIGATHAIDDRIENVKSLIDAGVKTYLMSQPHNQTIHGVADSIRVNSVAEFVDILLLMNGDTTVNEVRTRSKTGGEKGVKPQRYSLFPKEPLDLVGEVYNFGSKKYAAHNWRKGYEWSKSYDALMRHLWAWWNREDNDPESGLSHLGHALFHLFALIAFSKNPKYKEFDDRYQPEQDTI